MAWIYLLIAGLTEVGWAITLKQTDGWTRPWPSILTVALMVVSFTFLSLALRTLPLGTAYAVWTGIGAVGAVGTVLIGMLAFGEPRDASRLLCIGLIVAGGVGLKVFSPH